VFSWWSQRYKEDSLHLTTQPALVAAGRSRMRFSARYYVIVDRIRLVNARRYPGLIMRP
jgi:hypothetical protein